MNLLGAHPDHRLGFLFVTVSSRLTGEIGSSSNPISGMTVATLLLTCLRFLLSAGPGRPYYVTALSVGGIVCIAASNGGTTSQDLKTGSWSARRRATSRSRFSSARSRRRWCSVRSFFELERRRDRVRAAHQPRRPSTPDGGRTLRDVENFPGDDARRSVDADEPRDVRRTRTISSGTRVDRAGGPAGKYLVDAERHAVYLVDPGINGTHRVHPDGSAGDQVRRAEGDADVLHHQGDPQSELPWALVLLGVMIAVVLEMSGIPSLAFAVGVYLPLSSSTPIFIGGMVRWLERSLHPAQASADRHLTEEQLAAEGDKSPACCSRPVTSPAARSPASSSRSWPDSWAT